MPSVHPNACPPRLLRRLFLLAAVLLGAGLGSGALAAPLTIAVSKTPLSLPVWVADQEGFFADEGLQVRTAECVGGHRCLDQVLAGTADVATVGDVPIMFRAFERSDFAVVATIVTGSDLKLIARTSSAISTPARLAGKRVGVTVRTASQYFLDTYLLMNGVDPKKVEVVALQPEQMAEALRGAQVDAVSVWEPFGYEISNRMDGETTRLGHDEGYHQTFNLVVSRRLALASGSSLPAMLRAMEKAQRLIRSDPERAKAILATRLGSSPRFVAWIWPAFQYRLSLDAGLLRTLESEARWALREQHIRAERIPEFRALIHDAPLRAVHPAAVGLDR